MREDWAVLLRQTEAYYTTRVQEHGTTARGVDWNSSESQALRFQQLLRIVDDRSHSFTINDLGCGYGALVDYLQTHDYPFSAYVGVDLSADMIDRARMRHSRDLSCSFSRSPKVLLPADYTVASGIFNVKLATPNQEWLAYMLDMIDNMAKNSTRGFAFNVLTQYADVERMRPNLYYADPGFLFDHCQRHYSRQVAILHDYGLYEFTVLVRREGESAWRNSSSSVRETSLD